MAERQILPIEFLRECFLYSSELGTIHWRTRPLHHFLETWHWEDWNRQHAGNLAFENTNVGYGRSQVRFGGRRYRLTAARIAYAITHQEWPETVDHINGDGTDNRAVNLRSATNTQNQWNKHAHKRGIPRGAFKSGNKWRARATHNGKKIRLGTFDTPQEAHAAYCEFVRRERGEFSNTGPVFA